MPNYIPDKGDFVILTFDPQAGHEQMGRRPAIVISNKLFNQYTGLALVCPITNTDRNIPFHISIPQDAGIRGLVMVDQIKSVDFRARVVQFMEKAPPILMREVMAILEAIVA
ncbi:MAG: mRNA-degrading endonuclease [Desulfobacteraceae bacterium IS3]|nr:MAG: mRNA-degrading endonuclease [Desulfobacteraceae bacterium IS3]